MAVYSTGWAPSTRLVRSVSDTKRHTSSGEAPSSMVAVIAIGRIVFEGTMREMASPYAGPLPPRRPGRRAGAVVERL